MSVIKHKRLPSDAAYIANATEIYLMTIEFLTRLSARYARLIAEPIANLAGDVMDYTEKADSLSTNDAQSASLKRQYLLEARASLRALDARLTKCFILLLRNPQGCFSNDVGAPFTPKEANAKLDRLGSKIGLLIADEDALLHKLINK